MNAMTSTCTNAPANGQRWVIALNCAPRAMALRWLVAIKRNGIGQEGLL